MIRQKPQRRYSEAYKMQVISELESGKLRSQTEAREKYGIEGKTTIRKWLRQYGKQHLLPGIVRMEMPNETDRFKELHSENKRLKEAVADAHMDALLYKSWFEIACRKFGVEDIEGFKKN